jgi:hypothetical protein
MNKRFLKALGQTAALALLSFSAIAQTEVAPDGVDPPDRAGRLSYVQGAVSMQPAGQDEWTAAEINRPLTTGDRLWTDRGSRAELYAGGAAIRLSGETGFSFLNFDDDTIQMRVTAGTIDVRVRRLDADDQIEVDTPNVAVSLLRPGNYRIEVNDAGDTTVVKISEGEADVTGGNDSSALVHSQETATFRGIEQLASDFGTLGAPDAFDEWCLDRDRRDERAVAAAEPYVSPDVVGAEDLNEYGTWSNDPDYGYVWSPTTVAVGWAPYHYGRWVWISPWGWTWVDEAPWGFAPFHYGRWAHVRERWCWVPGPRHVRAVYAPALVGWVGGSAVDVSVRVGGGGVAWFPLAPREVYVPAYRVSPRYVTRVNVTNTVVNNVYVTNVYEKRVTNVTYRNRVVPGAVIGMPRNSFAAAEPVARHAVRLNEKEIARETVRTGAPSIRPERRSVLGTSDEARRNVRTPPAVLADRAVVARRAPPAASEKFVRRVEATPGRGDRPVRMDRQQPANAAARTDAERRDQRERSERDASSNRNAPLDRNADTERRAHIERNADSERRAQLERNAESERRAQAERNSQNDRASPSARDDRPPSARSRIQQQDAERESAAAQERERARVDRDERAASIDAARQDRDRTQLARAQEQQAQRARAQADQAERQRAQMQRSQEERAQRERADAQRDEQRRAAQQAAAEAASQQRQRLAERERADRPRPAERADRPAPQQRPDRGPELKRPDSNRQRPNDPSQQQQ